MLAWNVTGHAGLVDIPLLVVHGTTDPLLPPRFAQQIYDEAAGVDKHLVWIETHNHVELYDQDPYVPQALDAAIPFSPAVSWRTVRHDHHIRPPRSSH